MLCGVVCAILCTFFLLWRKSSITAALHTTLVLSCSTLNDLQSDTILFTNIITFTYTIIKIIIQFDKSCTHALPFTTCFLIGGPSSSFLQKQCIVFVHLPLRYLVKHIVNTITNQHCNSCFCTLLVVPTVPFCITNKWC